MLTVWLIRSLDKAFTICEPSGEKRQARRVRAAQGRRSMRKVWLATVAAVITTPLMGLPAWAAACVGAPVATYEVAGLFASLHGVAFRNLIVHATTSFRGAVGFGKFSLFPILPTTG